MERIAAGRTDLVLEFLAQGGAATATDRNGIPIVHWCAYYGDVSALRHLLAHGASLAVLGGDLGLNGAAFHGHWRLCEFLLEQGAAVDFAHPGTGETALHAALCTDQRLAHDLVVEVLLAAGADPNRATQPGAPTDAFMRDCRTRGETPLHRAAAFGGERTIDLLLAAGARLDARDINGDSPLGWASWHLRPVPILRRLCFGEHSIHPDYGAGMRANLLGAPTRRPTG
jgi:ankyrin repeat protein